MKLILFALSVLSLSCAGSKYNRTQNNAVSIFSRDTIAYCQAKSPWISNCLYFYKTDNQSKGGTFEKIMESDDGQRWYGKGKYKEAQNKVILHSFKLIRSLYNSIKDSTTIPTLEYLKNKDSLVQLEDIQTNRIIFVRQNK